MKKIAIFSTAMLFAGVVNAQLAVGVKGGLNYSNIVKTGDNNFKTEYKPGFHAGIFVEIPVVDRLSFAPEINYSQKGYKSSGSTLFGNDYTYTQTTNFIEIPILAKINAAPGFSIHLGPQVSFLTSTTLTEKTGNNVNKKTIDDNNNNLRKSLVGGVIGAAFNVGNNVDLSARYALDLQKNDGNGNSSIPEYRNQVWQLGLGFKFK